MSPDQGPEGPAEDRPRYPLPPPSRARGAAPPARTPAGARERDRPAAEDGRAVARRQPRTPGEADAPRKRSYTTYRAGGAVLERDPKPGVAGGARVPPGGAASTGASGGSGGGARLRRLLTARRPRPKRAILWLIALIVGWLLLSLVLFLISSHFERVAPPANVARALAPAGNPLTSANNILVLGSDKREESSREPGANPSGPSRSDTIMLIRTGAGHSARLSIPRDTVIEIPGHGMQKINSAYAFGGPRFSIEVIGKYLGIPINHLVEVNFESFPALIDSMGGITYKGGCIDSEIAGGRSNGGYSLKLPAGAHHLDGRQALVLARTRENKCAPGQTDINREEHQQALFEDMKKQLLSPTSFFRLPLIAWNTPPAIISDMSGETLLTLFASLAVDGGAPTKVLKPTGAVTLATGEEGLTVSEEEKRKVVAEFLKE